MPKVETSPPSLISAGSGSRASASVTGSRRYNPAQTVSTNTYKTANHLLTSEESTLKDIVAPLVNLSIVDSLQPFPDLQRLEDLVVATTSFASTKRNMTPSSESRWDFRAPTWDAMSKPYKQTVFGQYHKFQQDCLQYTYEAVENHLQSYGQDSLLHAKVLKLYDTEYALYYRNHPKGSFLLKLVDHNLCGIVARPITLSRDNLQYQWFSSILVRDILRRIRGFLETWSASLKKHGIDNEDIIHFRNTYSHLFQRRVPASQSLLVSTTPPAPAPTPFCLWQGYPCSIVTLTHVLVRGCISYQVAHPSARIGEYIKSLDNSPASVEERATLFDGIYDNIGALLPFDKAGHDARVSYFFCNQPISQEVLQTSPASGDLDMPPLDSIAAVCTGPILPEVHARLMNLIHALTPTVVRQPGPKHDGQPTYVAPQLTASTTSTVPFANAHIPSKTMSRVEALVEIDRLTTGSLSTCAQASSAHLSSEQGPTSSARRLESPSMYQQSVLPPIAPTRSQLRTTATYHASTSGYMANDNLNMSPSTLVPHDVGNPAMIVVPPDANLDNDVMSMYSRAFNPPYHFPDAGMLRPPTHLRVEHNAVQPDSEYAPPLLYGHSMPTTTAPVQSPSQAFQASKSGTGFNEHLQDSDAMGRDLNFYNYGPSVVATSQAEHECQFGNLHAWLGVNHRLVNSEPSDDNCDPGARL
ncbi:hypothetical protein BJ165DRAFT_1535544 [Panaeolus papilionaceus]|nr:hypothetical protein BJ165DRAFT_1535544 [Panaeolus papilionaceus]